MLNPSCFFLGASPDRRVFDPDVMGSPWGLLEIKCTMADSVSDCEYLSIPKNSQQAMLQLKRNHDYYYQVMGQMGLTGAKWCDFFVFAKNDFHVEGVFYDHQFFGQMIEKLTTFFFSFHLPRVGAQAV